MPDVPDGPGPLDLEFHEVARIRRPELIRTEGPVLGPFTCGETDGDCLALTDGRSGIGVVRRRGTVTLRVRRAGLWVPVKRTADQGGPMALALCENQATVLFDDGTRWVAALTERRRIAVLLDFRDPGLLARLRWQGARTSGPLGHAGLRDPHLVQHADGTPWVEEGRYFLTMTCAGYGFFAQAHWGVFSFDPDTWELRREATVHSRRGGRIYGDHAGQLVRDGDRWLVLNSSWGDFSVKRGVHARWGTSTADLMHGTHVVDTEPLALPSTLSTWDPGATRIDGTWLVSYVESSSQKPFRFWPGLATGPLERLGPVAVAGDRRKTEGPILLDVDGWRVLASDGVAREYPVFDLRMRQTGRLSAPYGTNIPHPQLIRHGERWLMVTFDGSNPDRRVLGYGGHGDVLVLATD